jgi:hypothetical protein
MNKIFFPAAVTPSNSNATHGAAVGFAALGAVFSIPASVDAAIVYSGVQNISATLPAAARHASNSTVGAGPAATAALNLDGSGGADFNLFVSQRFILGRGTAALNPVPGNSVQGGEGAFNIPPSNFVPVNLPNNDGLLRYVLDRVFSSGNFAPGVSGIAGVNFQQAGQPHYGWIRLRVDDGPQGYPIQVTAIDWAYESAVGTPIHVADVPEADPALALLAAGGTSFAAWRLRKRKQAEPAAA